MLFGVFDDNLLTVTMMVCDLNDLVIMLSFGDW